MANTRGKNIEYKQDKIDNFFKYKGVKPPERYSSGISEDEIDELLAENFKNHICEWRQSGNFLKCNTGGFEHGMNIGTNKRFTGVDAENNPQFEDIVFS